MKRQKLVNLLFEEDQNKESSKSKGDVVIDINEGPEAILIAAQKLSDPKSTFNQNANDSEKIQFKTGIVLAPSELTPTQKEIGTTKSLNDQCTNQYGALEKVLKGDLLGPKGGSPVLIFQSGGSNYVLDGHHRWSQFAAVRPSDKCVQCAAISAPGVKSPEAALALCHTIIFALHGDSPTKNWSGENLLEMDEKSAIALAANLMEKGEGAGSNGDVVEIAIKAGLLPKDSSKEDFAKLLGKNAANMNKPVANDNKGYTRLAMPQLADAGVDITQVDGGISKISKGEVEYGPGPFKESIDLQRWNKLAGLIKG